MQIWGKGKGREDKKCYRAWYEFGVRIQEPWDLGFWFICTRDFSPYNIPLKIVIDRFREKTREEITEMGNSKAREGAVRHQRCFKARGPPRERETGQGSNPWGTGAWRDENKGRKAGGKRVVYALVRECSCTPGMWEVDGDMGSAKTGRGAADLQMRGYEGSNPNFIREVGEAKTDTDSAEGTAIGRFTDGWEVGEGEFMVRERCWGYGRWRQMDGLGEGRGKMELCLKMLFLLKGSHSVLHKT